MNRHNTQTEPRNRVALYRLVRRLPNFAAGLPAVICAVVVTRSVYSDLLIFWLTIGMIAALAGCAACDISADYYRQKLSEPNSVVSRDGA